jgi:hypothetical protein
MFSKGEKFETIYSHSSLLVDNGVSGGSTELWPLKPVIPFKTVKIEQFSTLDH